MSVRKTIRTVPKPWGREDIFAELPGHYAAKLLHVKAGHALSVQWHRRKNETLLVIFGSVKLYTAMPVFAVYGNERVTERAQEHTEVYGAGEAFHLCCGTIHSIEALSDTILVEVSDCELDDVVRLEDRYGRASEQQSQQKTCMGLPILVDPIDTPEDWQAAGFTIVKGEQANWLRSERPVRNVGTLVRSIEFSTNGPAGMPVRYSVPWPLSVEDRRRLDLLVGRDWANRIIAEGHKFG